ncbi:hypothetical protein EVB94_313 [Rhizobium phage RHph_TM40]|uniref:Uncharacterized protein n=2 Tax=Cuauhnahuacvirus TaxID=3044696 RepID=A0A7S5RDP9_9CAUD|nr:hypothetical protein PQC16_gp348 [Rhizobium phage RHph_TM30]YP_010671441.1 hypothetical protein PQC17_gp349 [Rhizobium phage RHph_Y65]QIG71764.1 hypothetical protein EVB94_313 [Rhizobium phage RHph_TM40]QIG72125.1 hypothetical protein EVB95_311 [Rhizobium phage RHph_TM2_3B]QIG72487.1 hypothetical protein EVB96_311 [Rhizobium phage RHph_TM3_3_6]QIG77877.1 hypothetical protein EVB64_311 [Rhizobium phage RHph_TM61]QIG71400.1 hypothetical protein EVB93_313 [Rhizobium phage RHph_TM30]
MDESSNSTLDELDIRIWIALSNLKSAVNAKMKDRGISNYLVDLNLKISERDILTDGKFHSEFPIPDYKDIDPQILSVYMSEDR